MSEILRVPENLSIFNEYLEYSPDTGKLYWIKKANKNTILGTEAGSNCENRRIHLRLKKKQYFAHHVAWFLYFGYWPTDTIDHINGNPLDNRIENLRIVNHKINMQNRRCLSARNCSGFSGVFKMKNGKYKASISINNTTKYLGHYDNFEEACETVRQARRKLYVGYTL